MTEQSVDNFDVFIENIRRAPRVPVTGVRVNAVPVGDTPIHRSPALPTVPVIEEKEWVEEETPDDEIRVEETPVRSTPSSKRTLHGRSHRVTPGGRAHTVSGKERDRDILDFLALYRWAGVKHLTRALSSNQYSRKVKQQVVPIRVTDASTLTRLYALRSSGLVERYLQGMGREPVWGITNAGLLASNLPFSAGVKIGAPSPVTLAHSLAMSGVAAVHMSGGMSSKWGLRGDELLIPDYLTRRAAALAAKEDRLPVWDDSLTEEELLVQPEYLVAPAVPGVTGFHVPDLACARDRARPLAIEVELSAKSRRELTEAMTSYAHSQFDVLYLTPHRHIHSAVLKAWERTAEETGTSASLFVQSLDDQWMTTARSER